MPIDCQTVYDQTYDDWLARGYTAAQAGDAAQAAFQSCLERSATVAIPNVSVPGGRQADPGPGTSRLRKTLGKGR